MEHLQSGHPWDPWLLSAGGRIMEDRRCPLFESPTDFCAHAQGMKLYVSLNP